MIVLWRRSRLARSLQWTPEGEAWMLMFCFIESGQQRSLYTHMRKGARHSVGSKASPHNQKQHEWLGDDQSDTGRNDACISISPIKCNVIGGIELLVQDEDVAQPVSTLRHFYTLPLSHLRLYPRLEKRLFIRACPIWRCEKADGQTGLGSTHMHSWYISASTGNCKMGGLDTRRHTRPGVRRW